MREIAILGVGMPPFGIHETMTNIELFAEASLTAIAASNLAPKDMPPFSSGIRASHWRHRCRPGR